MGTYKDFLNTLSTLTVGSNEYKYFSLKSVEKDHPSLSRLPYSLKILLENIIRFSNENTTKDLKAMEEWIQNGVSNHEIAYRPARVLMQDFTGVPAIVDLAAMRSALAEQNKNPKLVSPQIPVDLVIDHSVMVDSFANNHAMEDNTNIEMQRNDKRYKFLRWGQTAFNNFSVVPPGTGICHQVNLEYLGKTVWTSDGYAYPDTLVGTDSHTTMINALGVLGWGVGGIEAEAAMLGQPVSMLIPKVVGCELTGSLNSGVTATDLVLTITNILRKKGVVGQFVEFYGSGLKSLSLADRATIANMAPEYGATCGFFPVDSETIKYLSLTGRTQETIDLVESYCKAQGLWHSDDADIPKFTDVVKLDLSTVVPCLAGPTRPQDRVNLDEVSKTMHAFLEKSQKSTEIDRDFAVPDKDFCLNHGDVVIAAITSCTNTSNPAVLMAAGLLARNAINKGLVTKPWVKTSLAPGSKVVTKYLEKSGLQPFLDKLGFQLVGYGCTTCIGNSGPLNLEIAQTINNNDLVVAAVLSGNRNFEGRVHPQVRANWLASPPLVVAYALAGTTKIDFATDAIGKDTNGKDVYLKDIWPNTHDISQALLNVKRDMFTQEYHDVFSGNDAWKKIDVTYSETYSWDNKSTYIQKPPFFDEQYSKQSPNIKDAFVLALLGDSVTTDHISPAGNIKAQSPAGLYLKSQGVNEVDFNSYGARRGNHEVMMRGTFSNIRIRNELLDDIEGGMTKYMPTEEIMSIYDAAMLYQKNNNDLVIVAGKEYGTGSSRDWAAKGTRLLGVKAVIVESFERIHRSNLIGMGVMPLQFIDGVTRKTLNITGADRISIDIDKSTLTPQKKLKMLIKRSTGVEESCELVCRIDTNEELQYYLQGGILQFVLNNFV